jgi:hypothetical protein
MSHENFDMEDDSLPSVLLSDYSSFAARLLAGFATLYYQSIELEELADDGLSLHIRCQPKPLMHHRICGLHLFNVVVVVAMRATQEKAQSTTNLQNLKLLVPLLKQRLHLPLIRLAMVFPKCILGPPLRILSEVVGSELIRLAHQ